MTFLPIVDRELRVATRRKGPRRIRQWAPVAAIGVAALFLSFVSVTGLGRSAGRILFEVLGAYALLLSLLSGVLLTSGCLSEEKEEGILGLLFLTDLHGYDVTLGKFFAASLSSVYALLAILPVLALPQLLGGVNSGEFWRMALALLNSMFVSLAVGMWAAVRSRPQRYPGGEALGLLVILAILMPLWTRFCFMLGLHPGWGMLGWASPLRPYLTLADASYQLHQGQWWLGLGLSNGLGWMFLAVASWVLPATWQDEVEGKLSESADATRSRLPGQKTRRVVRDRALLDINPIFWLASGSSASVRGIWVVVGVWATLSIVASFFGAEQLLSLTLGGRVIGIILQIMIAAPACRFFTESRRNGCLDLILGTPLKPDQILRGQYLALKKMLMVPLIVFCIAALLPPIVGLFLQPWTEPSVVSLFVVPTFGVGIVIMQLITVLSGLVAVASLGMWLSLTLRRPALAPGLAVCCVVISGLICCGSSLVPNFLFIAWSLARLPEELRKRTNELRHHGIGVPR